MGKKRPTDFLPRPEIFYDCSSAKYWVQTAQQKWIPVDERSLRRHLMAAGLRDVLGKGETMSQVERELVRIQQECDVAFAGAIAGYRKGGCLICGNRILVTSEPKLIEPKPGEFPILTHILEGMFVDHAMDQRAYFYGWLKFAVEALRAGQTRPGQALVLAGPRNTFKSSMQNIVTEILGGRCAKPYRYMVGATQFNKDLLGAEHQMIEDEVASTDIRHRRNFGSRIKDFTVNEVQSCHPKGRDAFSVKPFRRLTITLNDEPENLLILPPLDDGLADKLMLLKVNSFKMPLPTATLEDRKRFWDSLMAELPAFLWFLEQWQPPSELTCQRFGIAHYHHPAILGAIDALSPEIRLLSLIDAVLFTRRLMPHWTGTAEQLEHALVQSNFTYEARKLLDWSNATGTYLGRLAQKHPDRVQSVRTNAVRAWEIQPPKT